MRYQEELIDRLAQRRRSELGGMSDLAYEELRAAVEAGLPMPAVEVRALVPYDRGDLVSAVHLSGVLISSTHEEGGTAIHAHVSERLAAELAPFGV